jgi:hypothetical protein
MKACSGWPQYFDDDSKTCATAEAVRATDLNGLPIPYCFRVKYSHNVVAGSKPMTVQQLRYSKEEFARRGNEIYESQVRPQVEQGNHGKIVAVDIETGAFELAKDTITASDRLFERCPDAQIWCVRIGHKGVHRFGVGLLK